MTPRLSVVTPAYNEADNLGPLHATLRAQLPAMSVECEWIVVDDHSSDATFTVITALARADASVRGVRLARRCGSHAAIRCGVQEARGEVIAFLAADLQDPPELLARLLAEWRTGAPVVWGVPTGTTAPWSSRLYHRLVRTVSGAHGIPRGGAACFLIDRRVAERLRAEPRRVVDIMALIGMLDFPFATVTYDRAPRRLGSSRWTLRHKLTFALVSLVSLSPLGRRRAPFACAIEMRTDHPANDERDGRLAARA